MSENDTKPKTDENIKSKNNQVAAKSSWLPSLVSALIVAVVTSGLTWTLWLTQHNSEVDQKKIETRIDLISKISYNMQKFKQLSRERLPFMLQYEYLQDTNSKITYLENIALREKLKKQMPFEYERSVEASDFFPTVTNNLAMIQIFFGPETKEAVIEMINVLSTSNKSYLKRKSKEGQLFIERILINSQGNVEFRFNIDDLWDIKKEDMNNALEKLINAMYRELEYDI